ncbi:phospholipase [Streptomyces sp. NPDC059679]|uniref:phospholipase n=1 Tax=Streptomyces sp. NPDC059679 TaxID=3346903 RepID=UPI0036A8ABB9
MHTHIRLLGATALGVVLLPLGVATDAAAESASGERTAASAELSTSTTASGKFRDKQLSQLRRLTSADRRGLEAWSIAWQRSLQGKNPYRFDWSTDYCSGSPDKPGGFNFKGPCQRHDFGYRNYKKLNAFTGAHKERIDLAFLQDMRRICAIQPGFYESQRVGCRRTANTYYNTVRLAGKL